MRGTSEMANQGDSQGPQFDLVGYWSEVKLDIIREYAGAYSTILAAQPNLRHAYIDGFCGPGVCVSEASGRWLAGSPLNALRVRPKFERYFLMDLDGDKVDHLRALVADEVSSDPSLRIDLHEGNCNEILLDRVFPQVQFRDFWRALCVLDPYGLDLDWRVLQEAGQMGSVDLFLNFPTMAMNRQTLWTDTSRVGEHALARMTSFWGDESWRDAAYVAQMDIFGGEQLNKKGNEQVVAAFRKRLREVAGFKIVPEPIPMRNSTGSAIYYLFFASQKDVAGSIVKSIFDKYRRRMS
jgi:three-Cys-motif partner protein